MLAASENAAPIPADEVTDPVPPFDPSVVNGIYKKFVEIATRGTTMAPQFVYAIAKTVVGARMAGKVKFENLDVEPRFYTALIGETGSGKGEAAASSTRASIRPPADRSGHSASRNGRRRD